MDWSLRSGMALFVCAAFLCAVAAEHSDKALPHIVLVVIDDLGANDFGFRGQQIRTPHVDALRNEGVLANALYTMPVCSPSRTALMTGRYSPRFGLQHQVIWSGAPAGLFLNHTTLAQHLKAASYHTHGTGKWHCGFYSWNHTPAFRGFDSFLGFFGGGEDYFTHVEGGGSESPGPRLNSGFDLWLQSRAGCGAGCAQDLANNYSSGGAPAAGQYSTLVFGQRAVQLVQQHEVGVPAASMAPLFLYLPFQAVHAPLQAPQRYVEANAHIAYAPRRTFAGMLTAADEAIGNLTAALRARGMYDRTLLLIVGDNGGDTGQGGGRCPPLSYCNGKSSNYPFRGGKHTLYEGGVRGLGVVAGGFLPPAARNSTFDGIMHISDIYPTLLSAAGISSDLVPHPAFDGVDQWRALTAASRVPVSGAVAGPVVAAPRTEVLIQLDPLGTDFDGQQGDGPKAALRRGDYKLILGPPGCPDNVFSADNMTGGTRDCARLPAQSVLLFNVRADPGEHTNLAGNASMADIVAAMRARLEAYNRSLLVPPLYPDNDPNADPAHHKGSWTPWVN